MTGAIWKPAPARAAAAAEKPDPTARDRLAARPNSEEHREEAAVEAAPDIGTDDSASRAPLSLPTLPLAVGKLQRDPDEDPDDER